MCTLRKRGASSGVTPWSCASTSSSTRGSRSLGPRGRLAGLPSKALARRSLFCPPAVLTMKVVRAAQGLGSAVNAQLLGRSTVHGMRARPTLLPPEAA